MEPTSRQRLRLDLDALDRGYSSGHHGLWSATARAAIYRWQRSSRCSRRSAPPAASRSSAVGGTGVSSSCLAPTSTCSWCTTGRSDVRRRHRRTAALSALGRRVRSRPCNPYTGRVRRCRPRASRRVHRHARAAVPGRRRDVAADASAGVRRSWSGTRRHSPALAADGEERADRVGSAAHLWSRT